MKCPACFNTRILILSGRLECAMQEGLYRGGRRQVFQLGGCGREIKVVGRRLIAVERDGRPSEVVVSPSWLDRIMERQYGASTT